VKGLPPDLPARCRVAQTIGGALVVAIVTYAILVEVLRARRGGYALIRFIRSRILTPPSRGDQPTANVPPIMPRIFTAGSRSR
jgi:hypothetical protein